MLLKPEHIRTEQVEAGINVPALTKDTMSTNRKPKKLPEKKLAYSIQESAILWGVSYVTVHRLLKRGLLRSSSAIRNKIVLQIHLCAPSVVGVSVPDAEALLKEKEDEILEQLHLIDERIKAASNENQPETESSTPGLLR